MFKKKLIRRSRKGVALIMSMIFLAVFAAFAVATSAMSGANLQIANNQHESNIAFANAESGLQVLRYWINNIVIDSTVSSSDYFTTVVSSLQTDLSNNSISNIVLGNDGVITPVTLDAANSTFSAKIEIDPGNSSAFLVSVTGNYGQLSRTVQISYNIANLYNPIFDYGLATKGPILFQGNPTITGINEFSEADIYIESLNDPTALHVTGNTNFDGDIDIGNEFGNAQFDRDVLIAGDHGQEAEDNHVFADAEPVEFPLTNTDHFRQYANGITIDSSTDLSGGMVLSNAIIAANTDPCFLGSVVINGILFVESPNVILFDRNAEINGMIVGDGDVDNPGSDSMIFNGNFFSNTFPADAAYDPIRSEIGSSMIVPGFSVELAGNFASLSGVMAVSGFHLSGNASALVKGSIINYSDSHTVIEGNATLNFDRSDGIQFPAGFESDKFLEYDASSWSMIY